MKLTAILLTVLFTSIQPFSQGVTRLYKRGSNGGWKNAANWIQINAPAGQTLVRDRLHATHSFNGNNLAGHRQQRNCLSHHAGMSWSNTCHCEHC